MSTLQAKFPKHNSATIQYRLWKFYMIWFINTESEFGRIRWSARHLNTEYLLKMENVYHPAHESWLGWFTAYMYIANVFLTKLQGPIWPGESRDNINPNYPTWS